MYKDVFRLIFVLVSAGILGWLFSRIYTGVTQSYFYAFVFILGLLTAGWITIARIAEKKFGVSSMATKLIDFLILVVIVVSMVVLFAHLQPVS